MKLRSRTISAPSTTGDDDATVGGNSAGGVERDGTQAEVQPSNTVEASEAVEVPLSDDPSPCDDIGNYVLDTASDDSDHASDGDFEVPFNLNQVPESSCSDFGDDDYGESSIRPSRKRKKATRNGNAPPLDEAGAEAVDNPDVPVDLEAELNLPPFDEAENDQVPSDVEQIMREVRKKKKRKDRKTPVLLWEIWEAEDEKWVNQHMEEDANVDHMNHTLNETVDEPKDLILPLLRYQKEWLAWGLKQEESSTRGGILADEMGMGKTLQAIALVLAKREIRTAIGEAATSSSPCSSTSLPEIQCTLVICPVVAVTQWVNEIDRFTRKGSCKVLVYHGANRGKTVQHFSGYDFVLTTYSTVEADYRRYVMPPKKKCEWCGKSYHERQMATHLKYFCGPGAVRTEKQSKQDRKYGKSSVKSLKKKVKLADDNCKDREDAKQKQPQKKTRKKRKSSQKDQTDHTVDEPFDKDLNENKRNSILHSVKWERVVLDEAHYIKDKRSNTARAILALESSFKWALSGTPLQNRVGELYSLIRFLQIVPYSFYLCKDCDCRVLDHSPASECKHCPHNSVRHFCWWNRYVATPIQESGNSERGHRAMIMLKHKILKTVLLRRTKKDRASDLALPPRIISLRRDTLDIKEEDYYTSLYNESQAQFNTYVQQGTVLNNYAHIFDLLTRLRQAVDHPYLVVYSNSNSANRGNAGQYDQNEAPCGICHETVEDPVVTSCAHPFCKACLIDYSSSLGEVSCPTCSKPLTVDFSSSSSNGDLKGVAAVKGFKRSSIINRINLDDFQTSTKIDALREEIRFMIERDGAAKGIVFSQFTSFLDLIHYSLQKSGVNCVQLVGSMTMGARDAAIKRFNEDANCRIFLMSLKAGGVALNLTVASHVFLMDPWWNPAVERQAQDRIHRIGQYKPIRIVRFVIANTVEERILQLQEKKELVFEGTVGGSSDALGKLTEADLRFLFIT